MSQFTSSWLANYQSRQKTEVKSVDPVQLESTLHERIIAHCRSQWPRWKYIHARMDQRSTIDVGTPDFVIFAPGKILMIECKARNEKPTPEQLAWHAELELCGYKVHVIRSWNEFLTIIEGE